MSLDFDIRRSDKAYLQSPEKFIVSRGGTVFLRVLGEEPRYELMTATASEDSGALERVADQERLLVAALRTAQSLGVTATAGKDWKSREYVKVCAIEYISDAYRAAERFFAIFDAADAHRTQETGGLREIYDALAPDECGGDVYLSDGMWLSRDGSMHDRGR